MQITRCRQCWITRSFSKICMKLWTTETRRRTHLDFNQNTSCYYHIVYQYSHVWITWLGPTNISAHIDRLKTDPTIDWADPCHAKFTVRIMSQIQSNIHNVWKMNECFEVLRPRLHPYNTPRDPLCGKLLCRCKWMLSCMSVLIKEKKLLFCVGLILCRSTTHSWIEILREFCMSTRFAL